tara:strand:- start:25329 stop:25718 length:390 start_codon:yes stop_codon:yes gene_type:complete
MRKEDNRPIYLNILAINLPIIGVSSILHRVSGFALFCIFIGSVWFLDRSLSSEKEFIALVYDLNNLFILKFIFLLFLVGLTYHSLIGIKKLLSDFFGIGEELKSGTYISWVYNVTFLVIAFFFLFKVLF